MKKFFAFLTALVISLCSVSLTAVADDEYFTQEQIDYYKNLRISCSSWLKSV